MSQNYGNSRVAKDFLYQSYFHSTLLEKAVLDPGVGGLIIASTRDEVESIGHGLALRPESETPVAVEFKGRTGLKSSAILKPGQVIFPNGRHEGDEFQGFSYGLPYGWLGGGLATLEVLGSPRAQVDWPTPNRDIVIQRQRMAVNAKTTALATLTVPQNWPTRFPSLGTKRSGTAVTLAAGGRPNLKVQPSRIIMRLRSAAVLANASTVRFMVLNSHLFDIDSTGAAVADAAGVTYQDVVFASYAMGGGDLFATMPQYQAVEFGDGALVHLGCELETGTGVLAVDLGDGDSLSAAYLDIIRFGRL